MTSVFTDSWLCSTQISPMCTCIHSHIGCLLTPFSGFPPVRLSNPKISLLDSGTHTLITLFKCIWGMSDMSALQLVGEFMVRTRAHALLLFALPQL